MAETIGATSHYCYVYFDNNCLPFYIGKGHYDRYLVCHHMHGGNFLLKNKINKIGESNVKIEFIKTEMTDSDAINCEKYWIKLIGRRDLGLGPLCNMTDGGEGPSGYVRTAQHQENLKKSRKLQICSDVTRAKMSKAKKGKSLSESTKKKMSESRKKIMTNIFKKKISDSIKLYWKNKNNNN